MSDIDRYIASLGGNVLQTIGSEPLPSQKNLAFQGPLGNQIDPRNQGFNQFFANSYLNQARKAVDENAVLPDDVPYLQWLRSQYPNFSVQDVATAPSTTPTPTPTPVTPAPDIPIFDDGGAGGGGGLARGGLIQNYAERGLIPGTAEWLSALLAIEKIGNASQAAVARQILDDYLRGLKDDHAETPSKNDIDPETGKERDASISDISTTGLSAGMGSFGGLLGLGVGLGINTEREKAAFGYDPQTGNYGTPNKDYIEGMPTGTLKDIELNHGYAPVRDFVTQELADRFSKEFEAKERAEKQIERSENSGFAADQADRTNDGQGAEWAEGGLIKGKGTGLSDHVKTFVVDDKGKAKKKAGISTGEYIVPADVVSMAGDGSSEAGARFYDHLNKMIRMKKTGTPNQAEPLLGGYR